MVSGHRYRVMSVAGTVAVAILGVIVGNTQFVQSVVTSVAPVVRRLSPVVLEGDDLVIALATTVLVATASFIPLFKPRPRRFLDTVLLVQKRVLLTGFALAAIGYFNYTYRLPRATLGVAIATMLVVLPAWFVAIRRQPSGSERAVIVGDDIEEILEVREGIDVPVVGYVAPPSPYQVSGESENEAVAVADGGSESLNGLERLGGLSRLNEVLIEYDVDTAVLAFDQADRAEFFGTLHTCHEQGVKTMVHGKHSDTVLTPADAKSSIVEIDLEPWDWQDRMLKRLFDVAFAGTALLVLSPVVFLIALAIKVEGNGPVFFTQERTYRFGDTFRIYKFRTLKPEPEGQVSLDIERDRKTPLGEFLRKTHLDEIPQLWSILNGDMSVVGPRPAITELEPEYVSEVDIWRQRWFVKPGLTGLAQVNDATGKEPDRKIKYDVEYIRKQSLRFDLKIVLRQFWQVFEDVVSFKSG
ncbi:sugar transferase [Halorussus salilacus]|uniref:sugar transferase n=1 Tax=Halorussus salilacus TaxID=2953750 RepID=UPI00209FDB05|nr:sugar transferase [Halorussus salilacus]USZ67390.1 sugar transferase [Halorussus salilacus]